jgi:hypothetical protein
VKTLVFLCLVVLSCAAAYAVENVIAFMDTIDANIVNSGEVDLQNGSVYGNISSTYAVKVRVGWSRDWYDSQFYEYRSIMSFDTQQVPEEYAISSAILYMKCSYYHDDTDGNIWPMYYNTPYPVRCDHISFGPTLVNSAFWCEPLDANIGTLQDSAYVGWVGLNVTESYVEDVQMVREFSQYRFYLPWGPDTLTGYNIIGYLTQRWDFDPSNGQKLEVSYVSTVDNQDNVVEPETTVQIYPQPANAWIQVKVMQSPYNTFDMDLYNLKGQLISKYRNLNNTPEGSRITLPDLDPGVYLVRVTNGKQSTIDKITVIK